MIKRLTTFGHGVSFSSEVAETCSVIHAMGRRVFRDDFAVFPVPDGEKVGIASTCLGLPRSEVLGHYETRTQTVNRNDEAGGKERKRRDIINEGPDEVRMQLELRTSNCLSEYAQV